MKFFVYVEKNLWHWELRRQGGGAMAKSAMGFRTYEDAHEAVTLVQSSCDAFMYDVEGNMLEGHAVARSPRP